MKALIRCQCNWLKESGCMRDATAEDFLCDECRPFKSPETEGAIFVGEDGLHIHFEITEPEYCWGNEEWNIK